MRSVGTATAAACVVLAGLCICSPWASAGTGATAVTRSAHVAFENCNARHIVVSVTIPRRTFTPQQPVSYTVRLRNTGGATCGTEPPQQQPVPQAHQSLTVGPCGTLSAIIRNAHGVNVFPGVVAYGCPAEFGFSLGPHSTARATGSWNRTEALGAPPKYMQAPAGTYRLTVDQAVTVRLTLTPG